MKTKRYAQSLCAILVFMAINLHAQELTNSYSETKNGITLEITLILEGAHISGDSPFMHTQLSDMDLLPSSQPFAPTLPYFGNPEPVWYYLGNETIEMPTDDVVDWVLLELRDAPAPELAYNNTVVDRQAALLLSDGSVVGTDGLPPTFSVSYQFNLYVVVYHRNHLAIMSSDELKETRGVYRWDFTRGSDKAFSNSARKGHHKALRQLKDEFYGMIGGDGDGNGQVQTQDKNGVWTPQSGQGGYLAADFDLNGQVQTQDKNEIWNPNSGLASQVPVEPGPVIDIDGNVYTTVIIGNQEWFAENLKTTKYRNGIPIEYPGTNNASWQNNTTGAYAWYDNDITWKDSYGALYNWHAVNNSNGLCPTGWHVPSHDEWTQLEQYICYQLGNANCETQFPYDNTTTGRRGTNEGNALKSCRQVSSPLGGDCATSEHPRWNSHSTHYGTDEFGFSALPGGHRSTSAFFHSLGILAYWWSSTGYTTTRAWDRFLHNNESSVARYTGSNGFGFSVRCVRDID
ncbi:MAG: hypothetical protein EA361_01260 [Bacteroidetes bacterium]|nr:MAG: hypothetical protein EA361_01260 [Bacteroidota bacterium]